MTKEQFLHDLTVQLNLNVSDQVIHEQLAYYDNYIASEMQKGRKESEVIEELGSPRLLAKTIIETAEAAGDPVANQDEEIRGTIDTEPYSDAFDYERGTVNRSSKNMSSDSSSDSDEPHQNYENESRHEQRSYSEDGTRNDNQRSAFDSFFRGDKSSAQDSNNNYGHIFSTSGWGCLIFMIIFFIILELLINVIGGILYLLSPYLLPMMVAGCVVWLIMKFIK